MINTIMNATQEHQSISPAMLSYFPTRIPSTFMLTNSNLKVAYFSSMRKEEAFRMHGLLARHVITLFDKGAIHKFIDACLATRRGIQTEDFEGNKMISDLPIKLKTYAFNADF